MEKQTNRKISLGNNYGKCYKGNRERVGVILDSFFSNAPNTQSSDLKALLSKYVAIFSTFPPFPFSDFFLQLPSVLLIKLERLVPASKALPSCYPAYFSSIYFFHPQEVSHMVLHSIHPTYGVHSYFRSIT